MQIRAILEAAAECLQEGIDVHPEIMVPQVCAAEELKRVRAMVDELRPEVEATLRREAARASSGRWSRSVRACMRAARTRRSRRVLLVRHQRPHAGHLLVLARGCREQVPAAVHRVRHPSRQPVRDAGRRGRRPADAARRRVGPRRAARPHVGICGEHGGQPEAIRFCHRRRPRLRLVLGPARAHCTARGGAGGARTKPRSGEACSTDAAAPSRAPTIAGRNESC